MNAARANLAQLYQQTALLGICFLVFGIPAIPMVIFWNKHPFEISVIFSAGVYGISALVSMHYIGTLTRPMFFCLPGHILILRKILFQMGFVVSVVSAVIFTIRNMNDYAAMPYHLLIYGSLYMLFWTAGVWAASVWRSYSGFALFIYLGLGIGYLTCYAAVQPFLFSPYGSVIILAAWVCGRGLWKRMGRPDMARRYCNQPKMSLRFLSEEKAARQTLKERITQIKPDEEKAVLRVEQFFLPKIARSASHPIIPFLWGAVYRSFGLFIIQQLQGVWVAFVIFSPLFILLGYVVDDKFSFPMFYLPIMIILSYESDLNIHSPFIIKQGRRQRFWSAIAVMATGTAMITLAITILIALMKAISPYMPEINIVSVMRFHTYCFFDLYSIPLLLPIGMAMNILLPKKMWAKFGCLFVLLIIMPLILILIRRCNINLSLSGMVFLSFLPSWGLFIGGLYWTCFHRTLSAKK